MDECIVQEVRGLVHRFQWYDVYDLVEHIYECLRARRTMVIVQGRPDQFRDSINRFFRKNGIGWLLNEDGQVVVRGSEPFEACLARAESALNGAGSSTAAEEIAQARLDLSRRPEPDVTGAVQHAMAALECAARTAAGEKKGTLGDLVKKKKVPPALEKALEGLWGFTSNNGRHVHEGRVLEYAEAELTVTVAAGICTYLISRMSE